MNDVQISIEDRVQVMKDFLDRLHGDSEGQVALVIDSGYKGTFYSDLDSVPNALVAKNVQVAHVSYKTSENRKSSNIHGRQWLAVEFDGGKGSHAGLNRDEVLPDNVEPTLVIRTSGTEQGDNEHLLFQLDRIYTDPEDLKRIDTLNKRLGRAHESLAENVSATFLVRVPGSVNSKYGTPVTLTEDTGRVYTLDELDELLPKAADSTREKVVPSEFDYTDEVCDTVRKELRRFLMDVDDTVRINNAKDGFGRLLNLRRRGHVGAFHAMDVLFNETVRSLEEYPSENTSVDDVKRLRDWFDDLDPEEDMVPEGTCDGRTCKIREGSLVPQDNISSQPDARLVFDATNDVVLIDELKEALGTGSLDSLFVHTGRLRRVTESKDMTGKPRASITDVNEASLTAILNEKCRFFVWKENKDGELFQVPTLFPKNLAHNLIHIPSDLTELNLNEIESFSNHPVILRDGSIVCDSGYHEPSKLLITRSTKVDVPDEVTKDDAEAAADFILNTVLRDFPFERDTDKVNFAGLMMTPLLKEVYPRHTHNVKAFGINAANMGSGKSLLNEIQIALYGGGTFGNLTKDGAEVSKKLTSAMMNNAGTVIAFDNVKGAINSAELESAITSKIYSDRILGSNQVVEVVNDRIILLNGNNLDLNGDMQRRVVWVNLKAPGPDHFKGDKDFAIKDLGTWINTDEGRSKVLSALLTMIRYWVQQGMQEARNTSDSFAVYGGAVRGVLYAAGVETEFDPFEDQQAGRGTTVSDMDTFIEAIHERSGGKNFTTKDVVEWMSPATGGFVGGDSGEDFIDAVPGFILREFEKDSSVQKRIFKKYLVGFFRNRDGQWFGSKHRLDAKTKGTNWVFRIHEHQSDTSTVADAPEVVKPQMDDTDNVVANEFNWNLAREGKTLRWLPENGDWTNPNDQTGFIPMDRDGDQINVLDMELYGDIKDDEEFLAALNRK